VISPTRNALILITDSAKITASKGSIKKMSFTFRNDRKFIILSAFLFYVDIKIL